jgi:hypothetical protein
MNDWMVDIETTGLRPDRAGILSIGLVKFDRTTFEPGDRLYVTPVMLEGRAWDGDTMAWWAKQGEAALDAALTEEGRVSVEQALALMVATLGVEPFFWAKPAHFDYPFVEGYFAETGIKSPFSHRRVIDVRSWIASRGDGALERQADFEAEGFKGVKHTPIDDCLSQIDMLKAACA